MSERRQAHRREPITVVMDDGREFEAKPLPWLQRNELGNEIVVQSVDAVNKFVQVWVDESTSIPKLAAQFHDRLVDPMKILALGYPDAPADDLFNLSQGEMLELIYASLDVNLLSHMRPLVDPNSPSPIDGGGTNTSATGLETLLGLKTESSEDSSSSDSPEQPSLTSLTQKSSPSSEPTSA